ncbi:MAG TPA: DUF502 domain-containing protein, partial [Gemmataceae bacterium]|nr:DUF502 domain-containing protein [Gemmataceae bacterium]
GLLLAMPLLITLWVITWLYSILEQKVIEPVTGLLLWKLKWTTSSTELPYWFENYVAPIIAIIIVLSLLYSLDLLADTRLRRGVSWTLRRVPIFSQVYNPVQQVFQSLEQGTDDQQRQRMVLVTFPHRGVKLPAFVTGSCQDVKTGKLVLCLYVPTTPVPTSGFFLLVPEEEVTELNWNTEQTLQAVMSGGLSCPRDVTFFSDMAHPGQPAPLVPSEPPVHPASH